MTWSSYLGHSAAQKIIIQSQTSCFKEILKTQIIRKKEAGVLKMNSMKDPYPWLKMERPQAISARILVILHLSIAYRYCVLLIVCKECTLCIHITENCTGTTHTMYHTNRIHRKIFSDTIHKNTDESKFWFSCLSCDFNLKTKITIVTQTFNNQKWHFFNIIKALLNRAIGLMSWVFANGLGDQDSIPGRFMPKTQKNGTWCHLA